MVINDELSKKLEAQTKMIDEIEKLKIVAKVIHPLVNWAWYLICFKDLWQKEAIFTLLHGLETEFGFIGYEELNYQKIQGIPFEIVKDFKPCNAQELYNKLKKKVLV